MSEGSGVVFVTLEKIKNSPGYPSDKSFEKGPVAVIECIQEIPCNPCETSCRFDAITVGEPITNLPKLDVEKCKGCGECAINCPGLAIFVVDKSYSDNKALVSIPYEFLPLPEIGSTVEGLDRMGQRVCSAVVKKIVKRKYADGTILITVELTKEYADHVRSIKIKNNVNMQM
ncbi:4Fe-4S ferredoxin [Candidatus Poribacteria bacterium]|nr:4Fe-4S ferredoxin [Candidatus Poribacteria bacterium]